MRSSVLVLSLLVVSVSGRASGQDLSAIPSEIRGVSGSIARGVVDGNLIQTNYRNHGEFARWNDTPWGVWPQGSGGRHIDGIGFAVAGRVPGEKAKWPAYGGAPDALVNPVILTYRDAGKKLGSDGGIWGWLPLAGFHNPDRNSSLGEPDPVPARSDDPSTWPAVWPDRLSETENPGWPGLWNGMFPGGATRADLETYYVMDDYSDMEYHLSPQTRQPQSPNGVFYADPADSTKGGLGLRVSVRTLQWANPLMEDVMFISYRVFNGGARNYSHNLAGDEGLFFAQITDFGLGNEEGDENAGFDPQGDVVFGWDQDGIGQRSDGTLYDLGYTGFALLQTPGRPADGRDNDEDGIVDETQNSGPGNLIEDQTAIAAAFNSTVNRWSFERNYGRLEDRPAYLAGRWWTGDEDMDWVGYSDDNGNGERNPGERLNSDLGADGIGPEHPDYSGPDPGEGDGIPTSGEPDFDVLDVDESDQLGLTGYDLNSRPFYESGDNLRNDDWLFDRIVNYAQFPLGTAPALETADVEPFLLYVSGPFSLAAGETESIITAWVFGEDESEFMRNRRAAQAVHDADYNFAQAPIRPSLSAEIGDGFVALSWDTRSIASFDRFAQQNDFEGYKLYRGKDPELSDARVITDAFGVPRFHRPIGQWDLENGIAGATPVLGNTAFFDLGGDTGLQHSFVDRDVSANTTYYYALVAYDRGVPATSTNLNSIASSIDPQENTFNVVVDARGQAIEHTSNVAIVTTGPSDPFRPILELQLQVSDADGNSTHLVIGTAEDATDLFDQDLDQFAPPAPPTGTFDARLGGPGTDEYLKDYRAPAAGHVTWTLGFQAAAGADPVTITWSPSSLSPEGFFRLQDTVGGVLVDIDMRSTDSLSPLPGLGQLQVVFSAAQELNLPIATGWNLIGMSLRPPDMVYRTHFPSSLEQTLFRFTGSYTEPSGGVMEVGEGYWLRFPSSTTVTVRGASLPEVTRALAVGWNMIAGPDCSVPLSNIQDNDSVLLPGTLFGFDRAYQAAASVEPGRGYWIRATSVGAITMACSADKGIDASRPATDDLQELILTDQTGAEQRLYFGGPLLGADVEGAYTAPPAAPGLAFQAHFDGGRYATDQSTPTISLVGARFPVEAVLTATNGSRVAELMLADGTPIGSLPLLAGTASSIEDPRTAFLRITDGAAELPQEFVLDQNYPNPFNPVTTIRFGVPKDAEVTLEVFDLLGRRVKVLLQNELQTQGWHEVSFDASRLVSGTYFYRLTTPAHSDIRQLTLVK